MCLNDVVTLCSFALWKINLICDSAKKLEKQKRKRNENDLLNLFI